MLENIKDKHGIEIKEHDVIKINPATLIEYYIISKEGAKLMCVPYEQFADGDDRTGRDLSSLLAEVGTLSVEVLGHKNCYDTLCKVKNNMK